MFKRIPCFVVIAAIGFLNSPSVWCQSPPPLAPDTTSQTENDPFATSADGDTTIDTEKSNVDLRKWKDSSGRYAVTARFVTADDKLVVLEQTNGELIVLQRAQLSPEDQQFVTERRASPTSEPNSIPPIPNISTWNLRDGSAIKGQLIGFGTQKMIVRRERGTLFVNKYTLEELPEAYEKILPTVVAVIDGVEIPDATALEKHLAQLGGGPYEYDVEGVQLELDEGGAITIPLSLLSPSDAKEIAPNFARWKASNASDVSEEERYAAASRERLMLDSYERLRTQEAIRQRQLKMVELGLLQIETGIVDAWEVTLFPNNAYSYPRTVVVPARDSLMAQQMAMQKFPGWRLGPIRKLSH